MIMKTRGMVSVLAVGTAALSVAISFATSRAQAGAAEPEAARRPPAKNVIFFLGDGMGAASVTAARILGHGERGKLAMESLPRTALVKTFSRDAQTTDSAPSMSAYMTGVKMNNEVIAMTPETVADMTNCKAGNGLPVPTLLELAKAAGKAAGAVTTTEVTHATPAATYAHICHRDLAFDIAVQAVPGGVGYNPALRDGLNVLMGGGLNLFTPADPTTNPRGRADGRDLVGELRAGGYVVATDRAAFDAIPANTKKFVGLFSASSHLAYELDRDPAKQPSLAEMTDKAIALLKGASGGKGYFLMVEGGRIDHGLHAANAKRALTDALAFDAAIKLALEKVDLANTLIVVTADHDHVMVINGYPKLGNPILDIVRDVNGMEAKDADGNTYTTLAFGNGPNRPDVRSAVTSAQVTANAYLQESAVRLGSETHGGADVMLMAGGAGAQSFRGTMDNTAVFAAVRQALGL